MNRPMWCLLLVALLALGSSGALSSAGAASAASPVLRIVHASPDAPPVEVYVDGRKVATALKFTDATPYETVPSGSHSIQVFSAGTGPGSQPLIDVRADLQEGKAYSVIAADRLVQMAPVLLTDDLTTEPGDKVYVRLVHVSPDAPHVADVAVAGGPVVVKDLVFKAATAYLPVDAGTYSFEVRPAGTSLALATTPAITLTGGQIYSIFAMGELGNNTFQAVIFLDNARSGGVATMPSTGGGGASRAHARLIGLLLSLGLLASLGLPLLARPRGTSAAKAATEE